MKGFISYSHMDTALFRRLKAHLRLVPEVSFWTDQEILAGDKWDAMILAELTAAKVILLCVSAYFYDSNYIRTKELSHALERDRRRTALVIPVIMKDCMWQAEPSLSALSAVPLYGKPIQMWKPQENGLTDAAERIRDKVLSFKGGTSGP